jgi:hypothetical protein
MDVGRFSKYAIETQLITRLVFIGNNIFKKGKDSNCQWSTALPETKQCVIRICAKNHHWHTPQLEELKHYHTTTLTFKCPLRKPKAHQQTTTKSPFDDQRSTDKKKSE